MDTRANRNAYPDFSGRASSNGCLLYTSHHPNQIISIINTSPIDVIILDMNFSAGINNGNEMCIRDSLHEEGVMVKKGDVILRLSNPLLNIGIMQSEADLAYQENELRLSLIHIFFHTE